MPGPYLSATGWDRGPTHAAYDGVPVVYPHRHKTKEWLKILEQQKAPSGKLCSQCRAINWDEIELGAEDAQNKSAVVINTRRRHYLRHYLAWSTPSCDLCRHISYIAYEDLLSLNSTTSSGRLLLQILTGRGLPSVRYGHLSETIHEKPDGTGGQANQAVIVCSWPANSPEPFDIRSVRRSWTYIAVRKDRPKETLEDTNSVKELSPTSIDYATLTGWLSTCREHHSSCTSKGLGSLPGFRLIDCKTRTVINASNLAHRPEYIALSYIWGKPPPKNSKQPPDTLQSPPRVIDDAIILTLKLGLQYVWIDRYCIQQEAPYEEKQIQLKAMGAIYKSSYATIIAAAGTEPSHGLPGVSSRRLTQPVISIGSRKLVWVMDCPAELIAWSKWATRGWTFQEGLMPTRRIIFTDQQVYFQCCSAFGSEQIPSLSPLKQLYRSILFPENEIGPTRFSALLEGYIDKELTSDFDTINAFRGVLEAYESRYRTYTAWGVPIKPVDDPNDEQSRSVCSGLGLVVGLYLLTVFDKPYFTRRPEFPSWSWAGWKMDRSTARMSPKARKWNGPFDITIPPRRGRIAREKKAWTRPFSTVDIPEKARIPWNEQKWAAPLSQFSCLNTTATLHSRDGEALEWDDVNGRLGLGSGVLDDINLSHMLTLDCWTIPVSVQNTPYGKIKYSPASNSNSNSGSESESLESRDAEKITDLFLLDSTMSLANDTLLGIYLGCHPGYDQAMAPVVMVIKKVSGDAWERVGEFYPQPGTLQVAGWKCGKDMECGASPYCDHFPLRRRVVRLV
ncbi:HET-domain-containing protein [Lophiostoma macrostomum CBS 122681]|uniref:HET-domain-containing protein n=1 Tax=Lophiostoma macrostomum CBS 122681 TaxID=1314788 RepID=A0A6A6TQ70_9PLEO|nr:HET-domain-containing protein [Lophiostoma macrostomum CBS 122681]